ncbi:MAG: metallophosphoesterase [Tissierellales bacterium]|nr:metallophosphoesterase [Tissierellales bacterium]
MKILVISDTHRKISPLIKTVNKEKFDCIFFLGDNVEDGEEIANRLKINEKYIVRGNGDFYADYPDKLLIELLGHKILLVHGHKEGVKMGLRELENQAKKENAQAVFFGHTHIPFIDKIEDILFLNPGSPTYPRGGEFKKTFSVVDITKDHLWADIRYITK